MLNIPLQTVNCGQQVHVSTVDFLDFKSNVIISFYRRLASECTCTEYTVTLAGQVHKGLCNTKS